MLIGFNRKKKSIRERELERLVPFTSKMIGKTVYIKVEIDGKLETAVVGSVKHFYTRKELSGNSVNIDLLFAEWKGFVNECS